MQFISTIKKNLKKIILLAPVALTGNERIDRLTKRVIREICTSKSICIDVGAHDGKILKMMIEAAPGGLHYAFEPIPDLFKLLKRKFSSAASVFPLAVSDTKGDASFNLVLTDMAYSGLKKGGYDKKEKDTTITVETDLLDNVIPSGKKIDIIKMDVEGGELLVMKGAVNLIQQSKPVILFEFGKAGALAYGNDEHTMYQFITNQLKYSIYTLPDWLHNKPKLSEQQFSNYYNSGTVFFFLAAPSI